MTYGVNESSQHRRLSHIIQNLSLPIERNQLTYNKAWMITFRDIKYKSAQIDFWVAKKIVYIYKESE